MKRKHPSIYRQIVIFQFISIILVMAVFGFISYRLNYSREIRLMREETSRVMQRLSLQLSLPLWNLDKATVKDLLMQEMKNPYLSGIMLYQHGAIWIGAIITDTGEILSVDDQNISLYHGSFQDSQAQKKEIIFRDSQYNDWKLGELILYTTEKLIKASLRSLMLQAVIQTFVLIIVLNIFIIIVLRLLLYKPLDQITNTARRISEGEIGLQAEVTGTREIATLASAFNTMTLRLHESLDELNRYFTNALDLLCICDTEGYFHRLNREWESALGYSAEELKGRSFLDFVHPEDREHTESELKRLREKETFEVNNFVNRYRHKDGSYRWIEWRSFPYGDLIYAVARDITVRKQNEEGLRRLNESLEQRVTERTARLEEINKELESFSYSVSHDLRAPLRHISGFINLLETECDSSLNENGRHYLNVISDSCRKMGLLIDHLLQLSRTGRQEINKIRFSLDLLVREVIQDFREETANRDIHWEIDPLPEVYADAAMLRSVVTNLVGNAIKFTRTRNQTKIHIGTIMSENRHEIIFFIKDNGVGFDMKYKDKLFGVFQRLHKTEDFEGTGIGLANVQRIIQRHGGRTWAEGEAGKGASFYFSLYD